jgi:hypothetical protein
MIDTLVHADGGAIADLLAGGHSRLGDGVVHAFERVSGECWLVVLDPGAAA